MTFIKYSLIFQILFSLLFATTVRAEEPRQVYLSADAFHTSDNLSIQTYDLSYRNNRRSLTYPYKNAETEAFDWGVRVNRRNGRLENLDFSSTGVGLLAGKKFSSELNLEAELGIEEFNNDNISKTFIAPKIHVGYFNENKVIFQGSLDRTLMFAGGFVPGPVLEGISAWSFRPQTTVFFTKRLKLALTPNITLPSDGNQIVQVDGALMYGVSVYPVWFWIGVGGEALTNRRTETYWSPAKFFSYGLRLEVDAKLLGKLSGFIGGNINRLKEDDLSTGKGHYINAGLVYGDRNDQNLRLEFTNIDSQQGSNRWYLNGMTLKWNMFF